MNPERIARSMRLASTTFGVLAATAWAAIPLLVRAAYAERLPARLNAVMSGRGLHPVEHYLSVAAGPRTAVTALFAAASVVSLGLARSTTRSAVLRLLTGGSSGFGALWRPAGFALVLAAASVRLVSLDSTSLWLDEAMVTNISVAGLDGMLDRMALSSSAGPLHHLLQMVAFGAMGVSAAAARSPAALAGVATVVLLLGLARLGLPRSVAMAAAAMVAFSPAHLGFSRDATQYGLVVLLSVAVLAAGLVLQDEQRISRNRWKVVVAGVFAVAPWSGYQVALTGLAVVAAVSILALSGRSSTRGPVDALLLGALPLTVSSVAAYVLIARRQARVLGQWYLSEGYPTSSSLPPGGWLLNALDGFMAVVGGGQVTGRWSQASGIGLRDPLDGGSALGWLLLAALGAATLWVLVREARWRSAPEVRPVGGSRATTFAILSAGVLLVGSVLAASLALYPFGGMHQQLHATPIVLVGSLTAVHALLTLAPRESAPLASVAIVALFLRAAVPALPVLSAEREDIVSAVVVGVDRRAQRGLDPLEDASVWIYRDARPAVRFHFPDRGFTVSRVEPTDLEGMLEEVARVARAGQAALIFSQIHPHPVHGDFRRALQAALLGDGWVVIEEIHHPNSVALNVRAP
jgi:hypothetical protein